MATEIEQRREELQLPEASVHMLPSDLKRFAETETTAVAYSVAVGNPEETSVELYTAAEIYAALDARSAGDEYQRVGYQYRFYDPFTGNPVWRSEQYWSGRRCDESREIFIRTTPPAPAPQTGIIDSCDSGHRFAKLPDHPLRDGKARCPHCMAIGIAALKTNEACENADD